MNWLSRWLRPQPQPEAIISTALDESIRREREEVRDKQMRDALRLAEAEVMLVKRAQSQQDSYRRQRIYEEQAELREAIQTIGPAWGALVPATVTKASVESLRESAGAPVGLVKCVERLWELELALEDRGWLRELTQTQFEFSLFGIHRIIALCRLYFIKNPLIRRGIQVSSFYVFGRGVTITSDDEDANKVIQDFLGNPRNIPEVGHRALVKKEEALWTDGNLYFIFFRDEQTGELLIRTLDPIEIVEIVCDPNDASVEQYIHRRWMSQEFDLNAGTRTPKPAEAWYPALGYDPGPDRPETIGASKVPISWDTPVLHEKEGALTKWQYGVPLAYPAIDYARAVKKLIDNWCSIQEAMARFAWQVETQGGLPAIANLKQTFATTLANGGEQYEQNPPPNAASTWISGPGNKLSMSKTSGMIDSPEVGRRVAHLVYMVFGLPETFFADASVGTVATATSLDRPTELKFLEAQERWREVLQRILQFVLRSSATAPGGKLQEAQTRAVKPASKNPTIKVSFPSILEHEIGAQISAIIAAGTLNGFECTGIDQRILIGLLLQELQVENWQEVLEQMYPEDEYEPLMDRTTLLAKQEEDALNPPVPPAGAFGAPPPSGGATGMATPAAVDDHNPVTGAQPQAPKDRKPKVKRLPTAAEGERLDRAVAGLLKAAQTLKERRTNGHA